MHFRDPRTAEIGEEILPLEVGHLPEYFQKKAEVELHEVPEKTAQYIRQLKEMAKGDKRMKYIDFEDEFLLQHLRARKFNLEKAFSNLKTFVVYVKKYSPLFKNFDYDVTVRSIKDKFCTILPWRCQDGSTIFLHQLDNWRPDKFSINEYHRMILVYLMQSLLDPMTQVNGFKVIFDVKSSSFRYLRHLTPQNLYLLYHTCQEVIPGRFKEIHVVNDSLSFKTAWLILKCLLSDKFRQRIHFHSNHETLLDFFPKSVIPVSYGGDLKDFDQSEWLKKMMTTEQLDKLGGGSVNYLVETEVNNHHL